MIGASEAALLFLINTLFGFYLFVLTIRLVLVFVKSDYFNPLSQFVIQLTQPIVNPVRRWLPNIKQIELATVFWLIIVDMLKFSLIALITTHTLPNPLGLLILSIADLLKFMIETLFYAIIAQAILTWVQPYSPFNRVLYQITSPIMRPIQRVVPPIGGIDISPIPAILLLQLLLILLIGPLTQVGANMALG